MLTHLAPDLLVIGGGMAGAIAAVTASQAGARVTVVRRGMGATAISSGAVDLRGALPWLRRTLGAGATAEQVLDEALILFRGLVAEGGCAYQGHGGDDLALITPLGTIKRTQLAPRTMVAGDLGKLTSASVLFVGVRGYSDFNAAYIADSLRGLGESGMAPPVKTSSVLVECPRIRHAASISSFDLSQVLDDEEAAVAFGRRIAAQADLGGYTHVALPPVAGQRDSERTVAAIQGAVGLPCFETLGLPPSAPGYRLQAALDHALDRHGVRVIHAAVDGFDAHDGRVVGVHATQKQATYEFAPAAVVLASGKFISGGIGRTDHLRETVFDLPVFAGGRYEPDSAMAHLVTDRFTAGQPIFSAGVRVDDHLRPVAPDGRVIYHNLFAAGSVCAGYDYTRGDGGLGICLVGGYGCGKMAALFIRKTQ